MQHEMRDTTWHTDAIASSEQQYERCQRRQVDDAQRYENGRAPPLPSIVGANIDREIHLRQTYDRIHGEYEQRELRAEPEAGLRVRALHASPRSSPPSCRCTASRNVLLMRTS